MTYNVINVNEVKMKTIRTVSAGVMALFLAGSAAASPEFLNSGKVLKGELPFSEAVKVGNTLYLSGQVGLSPSTQKIVPGGVGAESRQLMQNIKTVLEANNYKMSDVVKCTAFLADMKEWPAFNDIYVSYFEKNRYPARSAFGSNGLALNARVEVECMAVK